jgi:hypothetical protein
MSQSTETIESAEIFPPEVCPICGYSLQGLPGQGICPECGKAYDSSELILHGWARGKHANLANTRGTRFVLAFLPGGWLLYLWFTAAFTFAWRMALLAGWIIPLAFHLFQRKSTDHPGGIQVRMSRRGIVQINDLNMLRSNPHFPAAHRMNWGHLKSVAHR